MGRWPGRLQQGGRNVFPEDKNVPVSAGAAPESPLPKSEHPNPSLLLPSGTSQAMQEHQVVDLSVCSQNFSFMGCSGAWPVALQGSQSCQSLNPTGTGASRADPFPAQKGDE